ncbi:hypothetical protein [Brevundimonas sp. A19_0]|uniref:hypothetical protein n=1 Tax=Brevundimonas sp. A19_0 TaxID=2821087 RepID=UPI001AD998A5|nr:hypothetical protein [Brevundimonas sp. A19_0]MBO9502034.1 hypothetical protein [Brevundimonas sp. A19_0]
METFFLATRRDTAISIRWMTLGDFRRCRAATPQAIQFLIQARSQDEAYLIAEAVFAGAVFRSTTRGRGADAVSVITGLVETETVQLHDGPEDQHLVPGVSAVPFTARLIAMEQARRAKGRGDAPLPSGGLFDDAARAQQELF